MNNAQYERIQRTIAIIVVLITLVATMIMIGQQVISKRLDKLIDSVDNMPIHYITVPKEVYVPREAGLIEVVQEPIESVTYISHNLPTEVTGAFKTYMDYRTITDKTSQQWMMQQLAKTDENGFRKINDRYMVAVGTYYADQVGKELRITLDDSITINVVVGDIKDNRHTNESNQFIPLNGNIVEFIVDTDTLDPLAKKLGNVSVLGLEGAITKLEEVVK